MTDHTQFQKLILTLQKGGESAQTVAAVINAIDMAIAPLVYQEMLVALSEEQLKTVEEIKDETEFQAAVNSFFLQKTGQTPEELTKKLVDKMAEGFVQRYEQDKEAALANPTIGTN